MIVYYIWRPILRIILVSDDDTYYLHWRVFGYIKAMGIIVINTVKLPFFSNCEKFSWIYDYKYVKSLEYTMVLQ